MDRGPIFVGGPDRCGKTLMRLSLSAHPEIAMTRRTYMWTRFYNQWGDLRRRDNLERCVAELLRHKPVQMLAPNVQRILKEFAQGEPTYARLFALFHQHHAERMGKARWGDQLGAIERYADLILAAYPNAKMLHMIRDPRDRFEVIKKSKSFGRGGIGSTTARWRSSVRLALRNVRRYPDCYLVVRYEHLLQRREETLRDVCGFLGESFVSNMITLDGAMRFGDDRVESSDNSDDAQSDEQTGSSTRHSVSRRELAFMQTYAGREMRSYGYPPRQLGLSLSERMLFALLDLPTNLARAAVWQTIDTYRLNSQVSAG